MARKKSSRAPKPEKIRGVINGAGDVVEQPIVATIRENFMPYAMSVILSRAIPEIDGFKPSHRKLLFTMYKMGLLSGARTKSANIVGATMKLNPHGDSAIYDTMVRLSRGYEALLHPYVDSKGNFGKFYSRDMAWAASRYTEAKLAPICNELFRDIDKDTVDFVDNYDNTMKEPSLLPTVFPSVLVNANTGIAVGMASNICSFNLGEICETTASLIRDPEHDIFSTLPAPDFSGGCQIIYDEKAFRQVYETGKGSIRLRAKYTYDKSANCIDVLSIPASTTCEVIIEKIIDLVKQGKVREISDIRDETGIEGLKITIDLKRGTDPDKLMAKLFRLTTLEDSFACNFNVLIAGVPRVMGIRELLGEWIAFRVECVKRRTYFDGSKDGSFKVISEYAKKDKRIIPIHKENSGVSATRNVGLSMATGDYIQFIDVDDWLPFDSTKLLVRSMEEEDADMVIADFYRVIDDKISKKGSIRKGGVLTLAEYADKMLLSPADFYYGAIWNKLYRKKIIDDHHLIMDENISFSEDAIFNLQYLLHVDKIFVLKSPVYYYVKSEGSLVAKNLNIQSTVKMKTGVIRYYDSFYKQILDKDDYEARKPIIYGFLVAVSTDAFALPIVEETKKLGEENGSSILFDDGMTFELRFDRLSEVLFEQLLKAIADQNELDGNDIGILYFLYKRKGPASIEEIASACRISPASCALALTKLVAAGHLKLVNLDIFSDKAMEYEYVAGLLDDQFDKAEEDYRALCYDGLSLEELKQYASVKEKVFANLRKTLVR